MQVFVIISTNRWSDETRLVIRVVAAETLETAESLVAKLNEQESCADPLRLYVTHSFVVPDADTARVLYTDEYELANMGK